MTTPAVTVTASTTVAGAARIRTEHRGKRLPVSTTKDDWSASRAAGPVDGGIAVNPATVTVEVYEGEVTLTGQLDLKSQLPLVEEMTRHIDGVVGVTASMTYRHDDTRTRIPDPMAIDLTQPPSRVR
jgi:osmotically-inducible protein OsmY